MARTLGNNEGSHSELILRDFPVPDRLFSVDEDFVGDSFSKVGPKHKLYSVPSSTSSFP